MRIILLLIILTVFPAVSFAAYDSVCSGGIPMKPSTPTAKFDYSTSNGNVLIDNRYGLMWMRCVVGQQLHPTLKSCDGTALSANWSDALTEVGVVNADNAFGYSDWRMPNIKELMSIVEHTCSYPALNDALFPGASGYSVWSNTPATDFISSNPKEVRYVDFATGSAGTENITENAIYIRLVRDYIAP